MARTCDWEIDKWSLGRFRRGQVVLRRHDGKPCRLLDMNSLAGTYLTGDGLWVDEADLEDPLYEGRKRDVARGDADSRRRAAIRAGDFEAAFPAISGSRPHDDLRSRAASTPRARRAWRWPTPRVVWSLVALELMALSWITATVYCS